MAVYVSARIRIGGALPEAQVETLWQVVSEERAGPAWGERFTDAFAFVDHLRDADEGVVLFGDEVRNGEFERLQAFCVRHGLTYVLTYDGCGSEWGPAKRRWRPGDRGEGLSCALNGDGGYACISRVEIDLLGFTSVDAVQAHLQAFDEEVVPAFRVRR